MKNRNKILSLLLLVVLTILLVSCGAKESTKLMNFVVDGVNEDTFVSEFTDDQSLELDLSFWLVLENGQVSNYNYKDGLIVPEEGAKADTRGINISIDQNTPAVVNDEKTVKTYTLRYSDNAGQIITTTFNQYLVDELSNDVTGIAVNYDERALTHHQGYSFDGSGLEVFLINANGTTTEVAQNDLVYTGADYHPRGSEDGKSFINNVTKEVALQVKGYEELSAVDLKVRVAGGRAPIHSKTSSFWNWVFLQTPMAYIAAFFGALTGNSLAWAIILTTIVVRTIAWPIYAKTNDMSMKMALAQPDMTKVQNKYAARKDPESQQKMQMELMAVYKKHNVNMFGCLLPLLQMPIFLAMFQVVSRIAIPGGQFYESVTKTTFIGIELGDVGGITWVNFLLSAIVGSTMFLLQKISAKKPSYAKTAPPSADGKAAQSEQTMKMVSYFMIFMMVFASFSTRSLAFYWVIGNIYSIGQTLLNKHLSEVKYQKMEEEKLYGKNYKSRSNVIDAKFTKKGDDK